jgi:futalosine hydrolase
MEKNILLVAATALEISPCIEWVGAQRKIQADVLISGIGLTATAYHLTRQLTMKKYDGVIQAGVAGCFDFTVPLGSVVAVKQDTIADQSVVELEKLKTLFDLKLVPANKYPFSKGWLLNTNKNLLKKSGLKKVKGISVNQITTSPSMIKFYKQKFHPVTESMEGAALHYVCLMENIPFIQLRSISNYIGERNKKKWDMKDSIVNLNETLISTINSL